MKLQEQISEKLKEAMKSRNSEVVTILRGVQASLKNKAIETQKDLEDADVVGVLKTTAKQLKDSLGEFVKAERGDLVEKAEFELALIKEFLPTEMERAEIRKHVVSIASDIGATTMADMGKLMGAVIKAIGATANGQDVKAEVEDYLKD